MIEKIRLSNLKEFQRTIRYKFRNINLLNQALIHKSYAYEQQGKDLLHNERLEFLGDAALSMYISDYIYRHFPSRQEGEMTRIRSLLVNRNTLETLARRLGIGRLIFFGKGEATSGGAEQSSNLVGAFEAILGAIYLDGGIKKVGKFIELQFKDRIEKVSEGGAKKDYKSILQEYTLKKYKTTPEYTVISEEGPAHKKRFEVTVLFGGEVRGKGYGNSKKSAEQDAAYEALMNLALLDKFGE